LTSLVQNRVDIEPGLILFARYAFAPNYFRYCGPENRNIAAALIGEYEEAGLHQILIKFEAAVPYLNLIAQTNHIKDIFDPRVVEAYWLGNELLLNVEKQAIFQHLDQSVRKRAGKNWSILEKDIGEKAKPHHSFHVFEIYRTAGFSRDGAKSLPILELMNNCRIGWGRIITSNLKPQTSNVWDVKSEKIIIKNKKFILVPEIKTVQNIGQDLKEGDLVSTHWGFVCDKISERQAENLNFWTKYHLGIANNSI